MAPQKISVVWFKTTDLRTHDHEPLTAAHGAGLPVLHLFVIDPRWFRPTRLGGFPRTNARRALFQLQALADLAQRLKTEGHELCIRRGVSTAKAFEELCEDFEVAGVYASNEVCPEELRVESSVRDALKSKGAGPLKLFWTYELHHQNDLPEDVRRKGASGFSGYRRCFSERCKVRPPLPRPKMAETAPANNWARRDELPVDVVELGLDPAPEPHPHAEVSWNGGETAALQRLEEYLFGSDAIAVHFTGATNFPHDGHSSTAEQSQSKLSPWLAHGCLSARQLFAEVKRYERERHKTESTSRMVHELYFRDFVRFSSLLKGSSIFKLEGIYGRHPPGGWLQDKEILEPWRLGKTGFPFLDASMRELEATGSCCHAGREVAAWFLVCDLGLDWRLGAEWFESTLIDYEPASNWFNWAFTIVPRASGGNKIQEEAKPLLPPRTRLQTLEAIYWAAQQDPDGVYIKRWVPELQGLNAEFAREPWRATVPEPETAQRDQKVTEEWPPPVSKERDRIGWARRTFPAGGSDVAVWWACVRDAGARPEPAKSQSANLGVERRTDPDDGKTYTLDGLREKYKGTYNRKEVDKYWKDSCEQVETKVDPDDGKMYTLAELQKKYQKKYRRQEIIEYFKNDCTVPTDSAGPPSKSQDAVPHNPEEMVKGWPKDYPLPLIPPASFFCIEEIAEQARKNQARKALKASRLLQEWGKDTSSGQIKSKGGYSTKAVVDEAKPKTSRRWAKAMGS